MPRNSFFPVHLVTLNLLFGLYSGSASGQTESLTLEAAVEEALQRNVVLAAERLSLPVAKARLVTAGLRPNPVLTVNGQTLDLLGARFNPNSPAGPNQFNARTEFPIERGGKRERRTELANTELSFAELQLQDFIRRLILEVRSAFTDVLQARDALALAEDNLRTLRGIASVNETRVRSGDLAGVELERSRVAVVQYEAAVEQARLRLDQAGVRLLQLLGRSEDAPIPLFAGDYQAGKRAETNADLIAAALEKRPDLRAASQFQARTEADLRLQLANGKVDYLVGGEYSYQRAFGVGGSSVGVTFSVPLPVNNRNQGEILRAQAEGRQASARIHALQSQIRNEVELAYRQHQSAVRLLSSIEGSLLAKARSVRDTTEYSYRRGEATLVEFLDAQRAFNDSVQTYNEARANLARSLHLLDAATGVETRMDR